MGEDFGSLLSALYKSPQLQLEILIRCRSLISWKEADNLETQKRVLSIDLETYSDVDLSTCGVYRYVEGDFHILLFAYAFDDDPVQIIDMASGEELPQEIVDAIVDDGVVKAAWNAQFERTCLSQFFGTRLSPDSWQCSMVWAASLSLPLALKSAAQVLKTGEQKDKAGDDPGCGEHSDGEKPVQDRDEVAPDGEQRDQPQVAMVVSIVRAVGVASVKPGEEQHDRGRAEEDQAVVAFAVLIQSTKSAGCGGKETMHDADLG